MEITITKDNFDKEVKNSDIPVLLDFWAEWCGPCKMLSPVISQVAEKYEGKLKVGKVNVDTEVELSIGFGVSSIPALFLVENGEVVKKDVGFMPIEEVEAMLDL